MSNYVLDTGIVLGYFKDTKYSREIEQSLSPSAPPNTSLICVVTYGEILSIVRQNNWTENRITTLKEFLDTLPIVNISDKRILGAYAEIDAYSQGRLKSKPLPNGLSSRNMGKNDLWIAAVASQTNATLLTTDKDFDHLHGVFFAVKWFDPTKK
jgi:predicted nucleic acid-binding protein